MKKSIAAITLAGSIALAGAGTAIAADYPASPPPATVSDASPQAGETITLSGPAGSFLSLEPFTLTVQASGTPTAGPAFGGAASGGVSMAVPSKIYLPLNAQTVKGQANADGSYSVSVKLNQPGTINLVVTGDISGKSFATTVTVTGAADGSGNGSGTGTGTTTGTSTSATNLADTGADSSLVLWTLVGAGALAAGAASVVVVRRRAKAEAAA